jgi:CHAD domain-containing protein
MKPPSTALFSTFSRMAQRIGPDSPAKDVHKLRTTARRIEALTAYLPDKVRDKNQDVLDEIHAIRKKSGKVRDLDVQLDLLHRVGNEAQRSQFDVLENRLLEKRERKAEKLFKEVRVLQRKKWMSRLEKLSQQVADAPASDMLQASPLQHAQEQLHILAARYPDSVSMVDPQELHQLRIELKKIRYTAELSGKGAATRRFTSALEKTQDAIGNWHDWLTLSEAAEEALNNYVSSGILMQLRSLTTSAFSTAIQSVTELLSAEAAPQKKSPGSTSARSRARRTA